MGTPHEGILHWKGATWQVERLLCSVAITGFLEMRDAIMTLQQEGNCISQDEGGNKISMKKQPWWDKAKIRIISASILVGGVFLIWISHQNTWSSLVDRLGEAIVIAGILGLTIDQVYRRELARDAFKASIGYILPDELKGEMEWIYQSHILCVEHIQTCELTPISDEFCTMKVSIQRKFRNVSKDRDSLTMGVSIDEWFNWGYPSKILSFGYSKGTVIWPKEGVSFETVKEECALSAKEITISLAPGEEVTVRYETEETKHINDHQTWAFNYPTRDPQIKVNAYQGVCIRPWFGYRITPEQLGTGVYRLSGTLLPGQRLEIRWWKKEDSEKWHKE